MIDLFCVFGKSRDTHFVGHSAFSAFKKSFELQFELLNGADFRYPVLLILKLKLQMLFAEKTAFYQR